MKYNVGDRWIWRDDVLFSDGSGRVRATPVTLRGYISELKSGSTKVGKTLSIIIKWENGRMIQYNDYMIEEAPQLSIDKEFYRNQKLELLGL
jgi:hypothetical protein